MTEQVQQKIEKPWLQDWTSKFFGETKEEAAPAAPSAKAPWTDHEALWNRFTPRPAPNPQKAKDQIESVFDKVIQQESRGKHRDKSGKLTTSPVGAQGITQVMPKTGKDPGYGVAPLRDDSEQEYVRFGKDLLRAYTRALGGDLEKGLAAYNYGIGNVQKVIKQHGPKWKEKVPKETKQYLSTILGDKDAS